MKKLATMLVGGAAAIAASASAQAQVQTSGFFISATGWYWIDSGSNKDNGNPLFVPTLKASPDDGWGGRGYLGYRVIGGFDFAAGFQKSFLDKGKGNNGTNTGKVNGDYWAADGELGYNFTGGPNFGMRWFLGGRYAEFDHKGKADTGAQRKVDFYGFGPRIGTDFAFRFAQGSGFGLVGGTSGSALFGKVKDRDSVGGVTSNRHRTAWNIDGQLGLDWEFAPLAHITLGYRADYWKNVGDSSSADKYGGSNSKNDRFMHGPFVRLAYNIGAPRIAPRAPAPAPAARPAPPPAVMAKSYMVFFEFDRSNLTAAAADTIKQASDAAKAGGSPRVNVTGHADRSGTDQYNMALSLRRANVVRDELVRNGVSPASIVIVARGETQPLVQTPDGAREPQNRRVEIILN